MPSELKRSESNQRASQKLIDAFWDLSLERYSALTVSEIAVKAGCNRSTFYRHYSSSRDLARAAIEREYAGQSGLHDFAMLALGEHLGVTSRTQGVPTLKLDRFSLVALKLGDDFVFEALKDLFVADWEQAVSKKELHGADEILIVLHSIASGVLAVAFSSKIEAGLSVQVALKLASNGLLSLRGFGADAAF